MTRLQTAIVYTSAIAKLLDKWSDGRDDHITLNLKRQTGLFLCRCARTNTKEFRAAMKIKDAAWGKTGARFAAEEIIIEPVSAIVAIWSKEAGLLAHFVKLTQERIDSFSMLNENKHTREQEQNAYKVADCFTEIMEEMQWIKHQKEVS